MAGVVRVEIASLGTYYGLALEVGVGSEAEGTFF